MFPALCEARVSLYQHSAAVVGIAVGTIGSGSDFVIGSSSGVDSLMAINGVGGGGILCSESSSDETSAVVLRTLLAALFDFLRLPRGAGSRFGVVRL